MPEGTLNGLPFSSVIGMEMPKTAIECALANPRIRAVLLRGGCGTAKTVLSRAVSSVDRRSVINCPSNISDGQLFGGIDLEKTLRSGSTEFLPGLLERADGNIVYVDDINLMDTRNLAEMMESIYRGKVCVERGTISAEYRCETTLIATMNPDNGELSDHMLDRFDICVDVYAEKDRASVLRRLFGSDSETVHAEEDSEIEKRISSAQRVLGRSDVSDVLLDYASELCEQALIDGHRGGISLIECAFALAALDGRQKVSRNDVYKASLLCLQHRRHSPQPPPPPPPPEEEEEEQDSEGPQNDSCDTSDEPPANNDGQDDEPPEELPDVSGMQESVFDIGRNFNVIDYQDEKVPITHSNMRKGRRAMVTSTDGSGRYVRYRVPRERTADIAFDATIWAAAPHQKEREHQDLAVVIYKDDIREKVRKTRIGTTVLFLVDASASIAVNERMVAVKGAVMSLLKDSYVKRDKVGLMTFRRRDAEMLLPPTKSVEYGYRCLKEIPTGGRTPLSEALIRAGEYMDMYSRRHKEERLYIVILTDGRGNVSMKEGSNPIEESLEVANNIRSPYVDWLVVDVSTGYPHLGHAKNLARALGADCIGLEELNADRLADSVRSYTSE